jgi:hypothetical protein
MFVDGISSYSPNSKSYVNAGPAPVTSDSTNAVDAESRYRSDSEPETIPPFVSASDDGFHQSVTGADGEVLGVELGVDEAVELGVLDAVELGDGVELSVELGVDDGVKLGVALSVEL